MVLTLPETMDTMDLDQALHVGIYGIENEVNVMEVVEDPALRNQRITEDVVKCYGVSVILFWEISDPGKLPWGRDGFGRLMVQSGFLPERRADGS